MSGSTPGVDREASRVFLGWDKPCVRLIAEWLWQDPELLRGRLVVVPTRESGRRLRELLAELSVVFGVGAVLGPRVATPEDFFRPTEIIPDSVLWAGWVKALQQTTDEEVRHLFPKGLRRKDEAWCFGVARQIEEARDLLAAG